MNRFKPRLWVCCFRTLEFVTSVVQ